MATSIDQKNFVKTALRLPPEVHAAVHASAQKNGRSYNAELVALIEKGLLVPDGFIHAPKSVLSSGEDGSYTVRSAKDLIIELSEKLRAASLVAEIFRSYQDGENGTRVDITEPPEWMDAGSPSAAPPKPRTRKPKP